MKHREVFLCAGLFVGLAGTSLAFAKEGPQKICDGIVMKPPVPSFTKNEKSLICGNQDPNSAWGSIPSSQAKFYLKNFLQARGFHHPKFEESSGTLTVDPGDQTHVSRVKAEGAPPELRLDRKRKLIGQAMTPDLLGGLEKWSTEKLRANSYGCPEIKSEGNPETGEVTLRIHSGPRQNLISVRTEPTPGMDSNIFRRYDAFQLDRPFNGNWMTVTENRIDQENIIESSHFSTHCETEGVVAQQEIVPGPPRILLFGVGVDTEGLIRAKATWRYARLGKMASLLDLTAQGSFRQQTLEARMNDYFLSYPSRWSLQPLITFDHENQTYFQTGMARAQVGPYRSWDLQNVGGDFTIAPQIEQIHTFSLRNQETDLPILQPNARFLSLYLQTNVQTHEFEYYAKSPRDGVRASLDAALNSSDLYSTVSAQRINLSAEGLWNVWSYDPPLLILGARLGGGTILTPARPGAANPIPPNFMRHLGGSTDLRGYGLQELPLSGFGALTSGFLDLEARLGSVLPMELDPFIFLDMGFLSAKPLDFDPPIYHSPGAGIRWGSPIGAIRTTLAHGYPDGHFQFFLSLGEEF